MKPPVQDRVKARTKEEGKNSRAKYRKSDNSLEARLTKISSDDVAACFHENRLGDAKLYASLNRGNVVYVRHWERFLVWGGHHWQEDDYNIAYQNIDAVHKLYLDYKKRVQEEADDADDKDIRAQKESLVSSITRRLNTLRDKPGIENTLAMLRQIRDPLIILPKHIDKQHYIKACPNGVIDLRTGELRDGKPEEYLLNAIETEYDPALLSLDDPCPETNAFLLRSMDDDAELVSFIWRLLGYGLITQRRDHVFTIFWGEHGRNGKDTLIKLITHVLGQGLSGDVPVEMFLKMQQTRNSAAPTPDVLALRGMCLAWINEAEEGQHFALAKLKKLTGGGYITARGLQDRLQTTWLQTHLPIMTTNELPKAKADDAAFWSRALIIKWPLSFVEDPKEPHQRKADKHLEERLFAEAKGVLVRLVQGAMEYLRDGLNVPEKVKEWTNEQRATWDDVGAFLSEWCELEPCEDPNNYTWRTDAPDMHEAYCIWYAKNRDKRNSISARKFFEAMSKKNIPSKRSNGRKWLGIQLSWDALEEIELHKKSKVSKSVHGNE